MILTINFLPFSRPFIMLNTLKEMSKIDSRYKNLFQIQIHAYREMDMSAHVNLCKASGLNCKLVKYNSHDYLPKIITAIQTQTEYSMKIDEDIFINHHTLKYIMDNLSIIGSEVMALTPTLSTGIPTLERFIEDVFTTEEREKIYGMFSSTYIPNIWGVDYTTLNGNPSPWVPSSYYEKVSKIPHHFKGIHPLRVSSAIQNEMFNIIKNKKSEIMDKQNYSIEVSDVVYFCNSVFVIRNSVWKNIINDRSLYRDAYDEVPFNLYKNIHGKKLAIIRNANSIHPSYNTVDDYLNIATNFNNLLNNWV